MSTKKGAPSMAINAVQQPAAEATTTTHFNNVQADHPSCSAAAQPECSSPPKQQKLPPPSPSPANISRLSSSASFARQCRICLLNTESRRKPLISPCRCAGSVQHVHIHCLAHWIEVSSRKLSPPPHCELCGFQYRRRPFVNLTQIHLPFMDIRDRVLNILCVLLLLIMGICAWVAVQHLQLSEKRPVAAPMAGAAVVATTRTNGRASRSAFTQPDLTVLVAVLLFFGAFFLAMFTQYRADVTLCRAMCRLWATNRNWRIRNYCRDGEEQRRRRQQKRYCHRNGGGGGMERRRIRTTAMTTTTNGGGGGGDVVNNVNNNSDANERRTMAATATTTAATTALMMVTTAAAANSMPCSSVTTKG